MFIIQPRSLNLHLQSVGHLEEDVMNHGLVEATVNIDGEWRLFSAFKDEPVRKKDVENNKRRQ